MTENNELTYRLRGHLPPTFVPHLDRFTSHVLAQFPNDVPHFVDVGAGSGSLSNRLNESGNFKITAVDSSKHALAELMPSKPNIRLVRNNVSKANFVEPIHAIISKDCLVTVSDVEALLQNVSPLLVRGALFMLAIFIDEPGLRTSFSGKYGNQWDLVSTNTWTPSLEEVRNDWYSSFVATRQIITYQYFHN